MSNEGERRAGFTVAPLDGVGRPELLAALRVLLYKYTGRAGLTDASGPPLDPDRPVPAMAPVRRLATEDLAIDIDDTGGLSVSYDPAGYHEAIATTLPGHLRRILEQLDLPVRTIEPLTGPERERVVVRFNATGTRYPREATIPELFREQARLRPDAPAIVHNGRTWTYAELDAWTEELAVRLRGLGVRPDQPVALLFERAPELVAGALAVLKAGGAYLPVDPLYPAHRIEFLLGDGGVGVVVSTAELVGRVTEAVGFTGAVLLVDRAAAAPAPPTEPVPEVNSATDLAYVMYTSGTTGRPKGVGVTHRNVVRLVRGQTYVELGPDTRILQANAIVFDSSTFELWASLLNGGTLVLVELEVLLDAAALRRAIAEHGITTLMLTPALFNQLADQDPTVFAALRYQFVGGDVLSPAHINAVRAACPDLRIINGYGPTENTCISTCHPIGDDHSVRIPIGRPLSNSTAYVCGVDGQPQPIGVPGELWVGGDGLARGYLNRPELTEAAFVPSTLDPGGRLYRTGDLARWRTDGTLDFLGRLDDQVKIRGFRVEPGEIEHQLRRHPSVTQALVVVRERPVTREKYLCGYAVTGDFLTGRELREHLARELPNYLIPAYLVVLDELPLTVSGKVDRAALPEPSLAPDSDEYLPARDEIERRLVAIWERTTGVTPIGVTDDIFDLGISSITAAALATQVRAELGATLSAASLLRNPTIERVAAELRASGPVEQRLVARTTDRARYPLSPQQRTLLVEQSKDFAAVHYNQPLVVELPAEVDIERLAGALHALVDRHEALRTSFGHDHQSVATAASVPVEELASADVAAFVRPFDLGSAPLLRAGIHRGAPATLLLDLHHLVSDGVSLRVLCADLDALYAGAPLPPPAELRYVDYAEWTTGPEAAALRAEAEKFWLGVFADPPAPVELPADFARPPVRSPAGATFEFELDPETTAALRELAGRTGVTLFHLLTAVYWLFLGRVTGADDLTVGTPVAGRTNPGFDRVVGMFVNTVCLRARLDAGQAFPDFLRAVRQHVLDAMQYQDFPFDRLADATGARDYARNPLFDTMFAVQDARLRPTLFGVPVRLADEGLGASMFDLNLHLYEHDDRLTGVWGYSTALFTEQTVAALVRTLRAVVGAVLARPDARVEELVGRLVAVSTPAADDIEFTF